MRLRVARSGLEGKACGIPHLAKNERDVGHPAIDAGMEFKGAFTLPLNFGGGDGVRRQCWLGDDQVLLQLSVRHLVGGHL